MSNRHTVAGSSGDINAFHSKADWDAEQDFLDNKIPNYDATAGRKFTKEPLPPPRNFLSVLAPPVSPPKKIKPPKAKV